MGQDISKNKEGFEGKDASSQDYPPCQGPDPMRGGIRREVDHCSHYMDEYHTGSDQEKMNALLKCQNLYADPLIGYRHICDGEPTPATGCDSDGYCYYVGWRCQNGRECRGGQ